MTDFGLMQRNLSLVREILLGMEKMETPYIARIDNSSDPNIFYNLRMMVEGGLLSGQPLASQAAPIPHAFVNVRMTWAGHELLDAARDPTIWEAAMQYVKNQGGSITIGLLLQILVALAKQELGL